MLTVTTWTVLTAVTLDFIDFASLLSPKAFEGNIDVKIGVSTFVWTITHSQWHTCVLAV